MNDLSYLVADEKNLIESTSLSEATKVGQVYCYLSSGPVPMLKIGKGKNGRQRMASWINEYPPSWRDGDVVFILDKLNQSKAETSFHKTFANQRVSADRMRAHLNLEEWQRLPDGATEWFYCDTFVKNTFRSFGIDLVSIYNGRSSEEYVETANTAVRTESWFDRMVYKAVRAARGFLGWTTFLIMGIMVVSLWGNWWAITSVILIGLFIAGSLFPDT